MYNTLDYSDPDEEIPKGIVEENGVKYQFLVYQKVKKI